MNAVQTAHGIHVSAREVLHGCSVGDRGCLCMPARPGSRNGGKVGVHSFEPAFVRLCVACMHLLLHAVCPTCLTDEEQVRRRGKSQA